jgi:predicted enzyme related to lactoylglutathione lyase
MLADMLPTCAEISYIEIGVSDASKSRAFLEQMFSWKFHPFGQGAEGWFQTPSLRAGIHGGDPDWGFLVYFGVADLEAAIADVNRLGGAAEAPTEEPGFGRFCTCRDPQGLRFGLHQR